MYPVPIEIICYHCQQSAEKALKGVLVKFGFFPEKSHDLLQLCKQCEECDDSFKKFVDSCVELSPYAVQTRYLSEIEIDETDMRRALQEARRIYEFVINEFQSESETQNQGPKISY